MLIGMVENSNSEYHAGDGVSVSDLKVLMEKSPLHLWAQKYDPNRQPQKQTEALMLGTAIHCAVLEPDEFPYRFAVMPEGINASSKIGRELIKELQDEGKTPLTQEQYLVVTNTSASARRNPVVKYLLDKGGISERSIYWRDPETGVLCKMRPDYMIEPCAEFPDGIMFDLKSAEDASPAGFAKGAYNYRYHQQADWYTSGFQQTYGTSKRPPFLFGAFEKLPPFAGKVYPASVRQIELGRILNRRGLLILAECQRTGIWPGYDTDLTPLDLPPWGDKELQTLQAAA